MFLLSDDMLCKGSHDFSIFFWQILKPGGIVLFRDYGLNDHAMLRFKSGSKLGENFYVRQDGTRSFFFSKGQLPSSVFNQSSLLCCFFCPPWTFPLSFRASRQSVSPSWVSDPCERVRSEGNRQQKRRAERSPGVSTEQIPQVWMTLSSEDGIFYITHMNKCVLFLWSHYVLNFR